MRRLVQPGIVLSKHSVRETDLLVSILGRETGKLMLSARHARSSKKRFFGGIDLFDCGTMELSFSEKPGVLPALEAILNREIWPGLREKLQRFSFASLCLEIADTFTAEGDPEGGTLFNPLFLCLKALSQADKESECEAVTAYFSLLALKEGGFNILDHEFPLNVSTQQWLEEMLAKGAPVIPYEPQLAGQGIQQLIEYSEHILGKRLRTAQHLPLTNG